MLMTDKTDCFTPHGINVIIRAYSPSIDVYTPDVFLLCEYLMMIDAIHTSLVVMLLLTHTHTHTQFIRLHSDTY